MTDSGRLSPQLEPAVDAGDTSARATAGSAPDRARGNALRQEQVFAAETRLLYENAATGALASALIALPLAYGVRGVIPPLVVWSWLLYMLVVAAARYAVARRFRHASPSDAESRRWLRPFVVGTVLAAVGWGAAGIVFYQSAEPSSGMFLVFVLGGVMLGGAALLAARPEAFLTFLLPAGLLTAARLVAEGGEAHLLMGLLAALFTAVTVATTWKLHQAIAASLRLGFDKQDLVESLQAAKHSTDLLNRELEIRVWDRTARLIEADRRKDEFLATLAHELRNPLAPIRFALENLKRGSSPALAARAHDVIERQVGQLVRLVDDLLDVARITTDKMVLRREPHDLGRLMATAAETIEPLAAAGGHHVLVAAPATPVFVDADGTRLVQVFANILSNAVKFTPPGGYVSFTADPVADGVVVRVRDTGIGIAPDVLPRVFEMFRQTQPLLERSVGGLGIGLALARRLVEMHGGRIAIQSPGQGQGTEVEIHLPVTAAPDVAARASADASPAPAGSRPLRVLVVEDNPDAAAMLETAVTHLGHRTRLARDGGSAVSIATEFAPDVILLDIGLPVMSGYAVATTLRKLPEFSRVYIAAVTGWGQEEDRRKAREAGCDTHFTKPLAPDALEDLLARVAQTASP